MKKLLLAPALFLAMQSAYAQTRLALYEEFTGENCGPCAATNPGFDALVLKASNATKIQVIKYQVPIPSAGTILYPQAKVYADARLSYYSVSSAPNGKLDGLTSSPSAASPGHPGYFTQAEIDAEAAIATPFTMSVTAAWDATYSNIIATINVTAVSAYAGTGSVYLRTALVEDVDYCNAPGSNGETHFTKVVRSMYPDATGTSVAASWTAGTTKTYNFTIPAPNYVDKSTKPYIVVWIQDDGNKKIAQSAFSSALPALTNDGAQGCSVDTKTCISGASGSVTHNVALKNAGSAAMTSADIYYRVGTGAYTKYTWTGSLAAGASTSVTMPGVTLSAGATYKFTDSLAISGDNNTANNVNSSYVAVLNSVPKTLPLTYGFETALPLGYLNYDFDNSGGVWIPQVYSTGSSSLAHTGTYAMYFPLYAFNDGTTGYFVVPTPTVSGKTKIEFWEAYAPITSSDADKLEVVYSTNCGTSWTALWSATGSAHATHAPKSDAVYVPAGASDYVKRSIDISALPANALLALRATANGGNTIFIDDINIMTGTAISEVDQNVANVNLFPNPANTFTNVEFSLGQKSNVNITVVDAMGRVVVNAANQQMNAGAQSVRINTESLASGIYMVKIDADGKSVTERFSVAK